MNLFKSVKTPILIGCIAAAVIGLLLLIWPVFILKFICILLAVALIAVGCLRVMTYFKETKKVGLPALNLAIGLFLIVSGIAVIAESSQIIFLVPFLLCLVVCFAAFMLLQRTYDAYKAHIADWWIIGILAVIGLVLSIILLATSKTAMLALGMNGSLILTGLSLIYAAAAVIAMEIFINMRTGKKTAPISRTAQTVSSPDPSPADSLDDIR